METTTISRICLQGDHGFCREDAATCACNHCHLGPCAECGVDNLLKMYDNAGRSLCATCYGRVLKAQSACSTACDRCGKRPAFRNPAHRRNEYLCTSCHAANGEPVILTGSVSHLAQPCTGLDISDDRHAWVHIRGIQFHCLCGTKKWDRALREQHRRETNRVIRENSV